MCERVVDDYNLKSLLEPILADKIKEREMF